MPCLVIEHEWSVPWGGLVDHPSISDLNAACVAGRPAAAHELICRRPGAVVEHRDPRALTEGVPPPVKTVSKSPVRRPSARAAGPNNRPGSPYRLSKQVEGGSPVVGGPPVQEVRHARDHIDPKVWEREDMRRFLAARDIGSVYRLLQRSGVSQRAIAARTGQSQSEISEIIAGHRQVVSYDLLERIALGLGVPRGWMGLAYEHDQVDEPVSGGTS
jgi:hypothetical protein